MSDVTFINTYNEVLFENFLAVLKQNILFQAQLKILETKVAKVETLEKQVAESSQATQEVSRLQSSVQSLTDELNNKNNQIQQHSTANAERHRIQTALNEKMRECETLKSSVDSLTRDMQLVSEKLSHGQEAIQTNRTLQAAVTALETTVREQTQYIRKLEDLLPTSKRKKLGLPVEPVESTTINTTIEQSQPLETSGGIF